MAICPECEFDLDIDELDVDRGDTLECDHCGVTLEIVGLNPLELETASEDEDDVDNDEDEEEEKEDEDEDE
jgi:lysine biosynthesis protein LysW